MRLPSPRAALFTPLDALRRALLRPVAPWLGRWFRDRALRVSIAGALSVSLSLALTAAAPLWLLALGPLALGVAHLAADARYLVVRQGLHRRALVVALVLAPALVASWRPRLAWILAPLLGAAVCARTSWPRRLAVALVAVGLYAVARRDEPMARVVIAHGHHLVALVVWAWWCRRPWGARSVVLAAVAVGFALIFAGALDGAVLRPWAMRAPDVGLDLETLSNVLSPVDPSRDAVGAMRWVLAYAFGQSVHYALWLRLIPEEDRARPAPRTFESTAHALARDLGVGVTAMIAMATAGLVVWAFRDLAVARDAYLRVAAGHGGLELGALALLAAEGTLAREGATSRADLRGR
jgi:hypothetical protein